MERSTHRILTKPVGSMHRPQSLEEMMMARGRGGLVDAQELASEIQRAVNDIVTVQVNCGMDYVSDGEMSKISFMEYPRQRLSGFDGPVANWAPPDIEEFQETGDFWYDAAAPHAALIMNSGPVTLLDPEAVRADIANLRAALKAVNIGGEGFMCAASPGTIALPGTIYYQNEEKFLRDIVESMRPEYQAIVDAGYVLQLDTPDIMMLGSYVLHDRNLYRQLVRPRLEALKDAMTGLPAERIILHACWGNWPGPHHKDVPLDWIIDLLLELPAQGLSIEATTQPHQYDWHVFENPDIAERFRSGEKILFLGLIDTKARALEPAEIIAERLSQYARLIGRENIIASTDCGFGTFLGRHVITPLLAEAKLRRLAAGAERASQMLWRASV
jgi:5-methyltetrahydropteroyltriglutamate--homocysteine methyltransferase